MEEIYRETYRFLRYIMPGISFFIEVLVLLWVLWPTWIAAGLRQLAQANFGSMIVAVLVSGGLGFLFSIIQRWSLRHKRLGGADHMRIIERLRKRNILELLKAGSNEVLSATSKQVRRRAWEIVNALWHERILTDKRIKGANPRANSLADLVNSTGTARFAALSAWLLAVVLYFHFGPPWKWEQFLLMNLIALLFVCLHQNAYKHIARSSQDLIGEILEDTLAAEFLRRGIPVRTHVDLEK